MSLFGKIKKIVKGKTMKDREKEIKMLQQKRVLEEKKTALFDRAQSEKKRIAAARDKRGASVNLGGLLNSGGGKMVGGFLSNAGQVSLLGAGGGFGMQTNSPRKARPKPRRQKTKSVPVNATSYVQKNGVLYPVIAVKSAPRKLARKKISEPLRRNEFDGQFGFQYKR